VSSADYIWSSLVDYFCELYFSRVWVGNRTCGVNQESGFVNKSLFARSRQDFSVIVESNQVRAADE
jgi:hypothetical protein